MVLVRARSHETWQELLDLENTTPQSRQETLASTEPSSGDSAAESGVVCEVGLDLEACHLGEECVPLSEKSRNGVCRCKTGWTRKKGGSGQQCEEIVTGTGGGYFVCLRSLVFSTSLLMGTFFHVD